MAEACDPCESSPAPQAVEFSVGDTFDTFEEFEAALEAYKKPLSSFGGEIRGQLQLLAKGV